MADKPRGLRLHAAVLTRVLRRVPRALAHFKVFNVTVINREVVPAKGRVIVACNHLSVSDPVFLWGAVRRSAVAIAMAELWSWRMPGINILMWVLGHIPVKRGDKASGRKAQDRAKRVLENDGLLLIYPEGKCSRDGTLLPFKAGVALLAIETNSPIIPAGICGSNEVKPLNSWKIHRKAPVLLRFGPPIYPAEFTGPDRVEQILATLRTMILILSTDDR